MPAPADRKAGRLAQSKLLSMALMNRSYSCRITAVIGLAVLGLASAAAVRAAENNSPADNSKALHAVTQIQCITPDGRVSPVADAARSVQNAPATTKNDETISCPLREGKTVFIITFSRVAMLDRFTFVNENAAAQGELEIAVSNSQLPADSPAWTAVDGAIPFARKRLFNLSMIGVEARYVKLSFRVGNSSAAIDRENIARSTASKDFNFGYVRLEPLSGNRVSRD
jgi:hypothetical protein